MTGILEFLGLPADRLLDATRALLSTVTWFGVPPNPGAALAATALLLRLITIPLWAKALVGRRLDAASAPVVDAIRERHRDDPAARRKARGDLYAHFAYRARIAHAAIVVVAANSTACLMWSARLKGDGSPFVHSLWMAGGAGDGWWKVALAVPVAAFGWFAQWYVEERRILTHLMPERVWREQFTARSRLTAVALPLAWALLLPLGALVFLLAWQLAGQIPRAVVTSRAGQVEAPARLWATYIGASATPDPVLPAPPAGPRPSPGHGPGPVPGSGPVPGEPPSSAPAPSPDPAPEPDPGAGPAPVPVPPPRPGSESPLTRPPRTTPLGHRDPRSIDGYRLLGRLGRGGMGTVYLAHREGSATHVALKAVHVELAGDAELVRRFQREAAVLRRVDGAFTARILDTGFDGEQPYIVMELLDGLPLDRYVAENGPIEDPAALRALAVAVAEALRDLHGRDIVHRDIKPSNIMLTSGGPKLVDFGIVRDLAATRHTPIDQAMGTLAYMAPEQYDPQLPVGPPADVWAWACTIVYAATGESPFDSTDLPAVMNAILERGPDARLVDRVGGIDADLGAVVTAALTREIADRPSDGADLLSRLSPGGTDSHTVITTVNAGWTALVSSRPGG